MIFWLFVLAAILVVGVICVFWYYSVIKLGG